MSDDEGLPEGTVYDEVLEVPVLPERMPIAQLLRRACENLGYLEPSVRKKPLRALGDGTGRSPQLYAGWLKGRPLPELTTLLDLQEKAGVSVEEWLVAFALIEPRDRPSRTVADLSPARQAIIRMTEGWSEGTVRNLAAAIRQVGQEARRGRTPAALPTDEDTSR